MADNTTRKNAEGITETYGTDVIADVHYPRSKMGFGADGSIADVSAASPLPVTGVARVPLGVKQLVVAGAVVTLADVAGGIPVGATVALIENEGGAVRWRDDGTDPTAILGQRILTDGILEYDAGLTAIRFIRINTDGKLNIAFYK